MVKDYRREQVMKKRLLAAGNRFLAIINAPITLWLLTAIAISFGSYVYQTLQECRRESERLTTDHMHTFDETTARVEYFKAAVISAETAKQLQEALSKRKSRHE